MKAIIHVTKECESIEECEAFVDIVKAELKFDKAIHLNGQVTIKFPPSHPPGIDEEGKPL